MKKCRIYGRSIRSREMLLLRQLLSLLFPDIWHQSCGQRDTQTYTDTSNDNKGRLKLATREPIFTYFTRKHTVVTRDSDPITHTGERITIVSLLHQIKITLSINTVTDKFISLRATHIDAAYIRPTFTLKTAQIAYWQQRRVAMVVGTPPTAYMHQLTYTKYRNIYKTFVYDFKSNKRLSYRWGTARQRQITLEVKSMNYLQLNNIRLHKVPWP